jgi:hypothetical protein
MEEKDENKKTLREGDILGKIEPSLYWRWRTALCEWQKAQSETKLKQAMHSSFVKDQEIQRLKTAIFLSQVQAAKDTENFYKTEYEKDLSKMEETLGFKIRECLIDDVTFEVKYFGKGGESAEPSANNSTEVTQQ